MMKRRLSLLLILLLLLSLAACGAKKEEPKEPEEEEAVEEYPGLSADPDVLTQDEADPDRVISEQMTRACIDAIFRADMKTVFDMVHPNLMTQFLRMKNFSDAQYFAMIDSYNERMQLSIDELNTMCDDWQVEVEILDFEDMLPYRLQIMNETYDDMDIHIEDGIEVHVQISIVADGEKLPVRKFIFAYVQCDDDQWYLELSQTKEKN